MQQEITRNELKALENKAQRVFHALANARKDSDLLVPPFTVEFAGSPKSGKSSTIDTVVHFFKRMGFRVFAPTEGASKRTPEQLRKDKVAFNVWTVNYAISQLLSAYHDADRSDLIILDRGCFDSIAWNELHQKKGLIDEEEAAVIKKFALHPHWAKYIDRLYLFTCDPDVSLKRETSATLTELEGTTMNRETLADLLGEYNSLMRALETYPVLKIDTTGAGTPKTSGYLVASDIIELWESKLGMN
jgi:hypothetical protein